MGIRRLTISGLAVLLAAPLAADPAAGGEADEAFLRAGLPAGLQGRIVEAIDKGIDPLRRMLEAALDEHGGWVPPPPVQVNNPMGLIGRAENHIPGEIALKLLTLVKCGNGPGDPLVDRTFAWFREKQSTQEQFYGTYDAAVLLMALQAYLHHPASLDRPEEDWNADLQWAARLAFWIASGEADGSWTYICPGYEEPRGGYDIGRPRRRRAYRAGSDGPEEEPVGDRVRFHRAPPIPDFKQGMPASAYDNSNSQYAVLGLLAATKLGIEFPDELWDAVGRHWITKQVPNGPEVAVAVEGEAREEGEASTLLERTARARGWEYDGNPTPDGTRATGSMTVAGIALVRAALDRTGDRRLRAELDQALLDGWAWLQEHFAVDANPGSRTWHYYYLYGLERAGVFSRVRLLGGHDWYVEGAERLLADQRPDGSWPRTDEDTCFALLFLKRASGGVMEEPYEVGAAGR